MTNLERLEVLTEQICEGLLDVRDNASMAICNGAIGAEIPPHSHHSKEYLLVLTGKILVAVDTGPHPGAVILYPGDFIEIAKNALHSIKFGEDSSYYQIQYDLIY